MTTFIKFFGQILIDMPHLDINTQHRSLGHDDFGCKGNGDNPRMEGKLEVGHIIRTRVPMGIMAMVCNKIMAYIDMELILRFMVALDQCPPSDYHNKNIMAPLLPLVCSSSNKNS